jgi:uncharacterized membrane protein
MPGPKALWDRHPKVRSGDQLTVGERAADSLKKWFGTWSALGAVGLMIMIWIGVQSLGGPKWDVYPFILLNLILSCIAAVQGIILQISANRGDRISSELALHSYRNGQEILTINRTQLQILEEMRALRQAVDDAAAAPDPPA